MCNQENWVLNQKVADVTKIKLRNLKTEFIPKIRRIFKWCRDRKDRFNIGENGFLNIYFNWNVK